MVGLSRPLHLQIHLIDSMSATPTKKTLLVWANPLSLAATYGIEFLSLPQGT